MSDNTQQSTEVTHTKLRSPPKYNVIMLNDDATPMDFVISALTTIFHKNGDEAHTLTMHIHENGRAIAGTYIFEVAEQKVSETLTAARLAGHPLTLTLEEVE